jgi:hypothetical protein
VRNQTSSVRITLSDPELPRSGLVQPLVMQYNERVVGQRSDVYALVCTN